MPHAWLVRVCRWFAPRPAGTEVRSFLQGLTHRRRPASSGRRPCLELEPLEGRWVPSTFTVLSGSDSGSDTMSLRFLLGTVPAGSTIDFAPAVRSITLTTNTPLTIDRKHLDQLFGTVAEVLKTID